MAGWFIDIFVEYFFRVLFHGLNLARSRKWSLAKATVLSADCPLATCGCEVASIDYEYTVNGEKYGDSFGKPFISKKSGEDYAALFVKGAQFRVRVKPSDATKSVPLWGPPAV